MVFKWTTANAAGADGSQSGRDPDLVGVPTLWLLEPMWDETARIWPSGGWQRGRLLEQCDIAAAKRVRTEGQRCAVEMADTETGPLDFYFI